MIEWMRALRDASEHDLDEERGREGPRSRKLLAVVSSTAFSMLLLELLLTRMYPFFLGDVSSFVAIPVAMFGLSVGALLLHLWRGPVSLRALPTLLPAMAFATLLSFVLLFLLFNLVFGLTHHQLQSPPHDALKTAVLSLIFVPPFALAGVVLSVAFRQGAGWVGGLYAADLAGSALACVVTPIALHHADLPVVICLPFWVLWLAAVVVYSKVRVPLLTGGGGFLALLTVAAANQWVFVEVPDPNVMGVRYSKGHTVVEHAHRWNDISRVALLSWAKEGAPTQWRVLHDDGVSNVVVVPYEPERVTAPPEHDSVHGLPKLLDHPPQRALVIFAGAGRDMIRLHQQAGGALDVTGVEINGLVPEMATLGGDPFHLRDFYALPEVHLVIDEGRAFLDRDKTRYDLIFAGSNGAQTAVRTGHVRKFLDTDGAVRAELDHLEPDGMLVYYVQPYGLKLEILASELAARGLAPLPDAVIALGSRPEVRPDSGDTLLVKPSGFSRGEVERIVAEALASELYVHHAPFGHRGPPSFEERIEGAPHADVPIPTDDRPYERMLSVRGFTPFPPLSAFRDLAYSLDWIKLFTMGLFLGLSALTVGVFYAVPRGPRRLPAWAAAWFLGTGICYMLAEIGLMAKLELFLGSPLLSTAVVLASFLLANAAGSAWVGRRRAEGRPVAPVLPAALAMVLVPATLWLIDGVLVHHLGHPVALKALVGVLAAAPLATVLGAFYPVGVGLVDDRGMSELVPMTFGLATLSSVIGSTFALVVMIDVGARQIVLWAALGYAVVTVVTGGLSAVRRA
ncbi:MAG: hypothetical protein H6738_25445 [Alphaproteobacteria bacterium]|nr:hypothetical protein [Alphaproteobacteria bacterium]MCB9700159.1 hypothetical protein [Alphaproteobacteria bacterium]